MREGSNETAAKRFMREMEVMGRLNHPHIVNVFEAGETDDGELFIVSEVLKGRTLARQIKQHGPVSAARAIRIGYQIAEALQAAHSANVLHRDLKPTTIRLISRDDTRDFVKVLDFGIARFLEDDEFGGGEQLTAAGKVIGTPHYMAPEQIASKPMDHRVDLYALGCLMYYMLTGRTPFTGKMFEVMRAHAFERAKPPSAVTDKPIPGDLEAVIMELLQKDPNQRPATAEQVAAMLRNLEKSEMEPVSTGLSFEDLGLNGDLPTSDDDTLPLPNDRHVDDAAYQKAKQARLAFMGFGAVMAAGAVLLVVLIAGVAVAMGF